MSGSDLVTLLLKPRVLQATLMLRSGELKAFFFSFFLNIKTISNKSTVVLLKEEVISVFLLCTQAAQQALAMHQGPLRATNIGSATSHPYLYAF